MPKPGRGAAASVPRPTHQWLAPLFTYLDYGAEITTPSGASGLPNGAWAGRRVQYTQVGNATGVVGVYGFTGIAQLATGVNGLLSGAAGATSLGGPSGFGATGLGASGFYTYLGQAAFNGGTGNFYNANDIVTALKNLGVLKP